jgi:hypothetical protein
LLKTRVVSGNRVSAAVTATKSTAPLGAEVLSPNLPANLSYRVQAGWPQSQAISASSDPASLHSTLQYLSPAGGMQMQDKCAHFLVCSLAIKFLLEIASNQFVTIVEVAQVPHDQVVPVGWKIENY